MDNQQEVEVSVRCRGISDNEKARGATRVVKINGDKILLHNPYPSSSGVKEHNFSFSHCYSWESKTDHVYKDIGDALIKRTLDGYHSTVLVYGQSGSGKTHMLTGTPEEPGLMTLTSQALAKIVEEAPKDKLFFLSVSFAEITDEAVRDLLNPSGRDLKVRKHPQFGTYIDDLAELSVSNHEDVIRLHEQGIRVSKFSVSDFQTAQAKATTVFTITFEQGTKGRQNTNGLLSKISFVDLASSNHVSQSEDGAFMSRSISSLSSVVSALCDNKAVPQFRDSSLTRLLQDAISGNSFTTLLAAISPLDSDFYETLSTLKFAKSVQNVNTVPKKNVNDTTAVIAELRDKINRLRDKLAGSSGVLIEAPSAEDVNKMEELVKDLQLAKMQTWEEKERLSEMYEEERRHHLSNRGILDWVLDSMKKDSKEIQQKLASLQKDKDKLMIDYKEKRRVVDELKDVLQNMITEYSKLTESGKAGDEEGKKKVAEIHGLKEQLKHESESLKKVKQSLKDIQEKQKAEKEEAKLQTINLKGNWELQQKLETDQRDKMEKENMATLADEMDRIKIESEHEKADLKLKKAQGETYTEEQSLKFEMELVDLRAEKAVMAIKLKSLETEKKKLKKDLEEVYKRHSEEQELQQLQHFQTFRNYREVYEEQRASLEQRYRTLLEDAIQDSIFLSSRNQELIDENQNLRQDMAELRDQLSMKGERPTSPQNDEY